MIERYFWTLLKWHDGVLRRHTMKKHEKLRDKKVRGNVFRVTKQPGAVSFTSLFKALWISPKPQINQTPSEQGLAVQVDQNSKPTTVRT